MKFIAPALRLSDSQMLDAPAYVPVMYEGEHVADARFDGEAYVFDVFRGTIENALKDGKISPRVRFKDEPATTGGRPKRVYTCVELTAIA